MMILATAKLCGYSTLKERDIAIAKYVLKTDASMREAGEHFELSKTTIERACSYVIELGMTNKRYARMAKALTAQFRRHIDDSLFKTNKPAKYPWSNLFKRRCK